MYKVSNYAKPTWGLNPKVIKTIYKLVIEKIILYASEIWYRPTAKILTKLPQLQRVSLILITKSYRTVANDTLNILSKYNAAG